MCGDRVRASEVCLLLSASCVEAVCAICTRPLNAWKQVKYMVFEWRTIEFRSIWNSPEGCLLSLLQYSHFQWHNPLGYYLTNWRRRRQLINNTDRVEEKMDCWFIFLDFFRAFNLHRTHHTHSWTSWSKFRIDSIHASTVCRAICPTKLWSAKHSNREFSLKLVSSTLWAVVVFLSLFSFKLKSTTTATPSNPNPSPNTFRCSWLLYVFAYRQKIVPAADLYEKLLQVFYLRKTHSLAGRPAES